MSMFLLSFALVCVYLCVVSFVFVLIPMNFESRPTLRVLGLETLEGKKRKKSTALFRRVALINKPLCAGALRTRLSRDLAIARVALAPEEFLFIKEIGVVVVLFLTRSMIENPDFVFMWLALSFVIGYMLPEFIVKAKITKVKNTIVKELPDAIDLLGLCVNAGLDFMLSLKWVVEKSPPSFMVDELNLVLQEINVGKTRRDAIRDLARKYELADLSTFSRTLIQADKMGTSVTEALNILSEDMRLARFRRGEQIALKAPMKMLVPLLVFIFPVVGILVAGPIMIDFIQNNPFAGFGN